jgi:hypothetical protein
MKRTWLYALFFFTGIPVHSQIITVIDATTRQIIAGVAVFSKVPQSAAITNAKGQVSMHTFSGADSIYFQHVSYQPCKLQTGRVHTGRNEIKIVYCGTHGIQYFTG